MSAKQCPNCLMWVTDEERLSGQCPGCKSFFESEIPTSSFSHQSPVVPAPSIRTATPSSQARQRESSGGWKAWWLIPLAVIGLRACSTIVNTPTRHHRVPEYDVNFEPGFQRPPPPSINTERLQRMLEEMRKQREQSETQEFIFDPESFEPPPLETTNGLRLPEEPTSP